MNIKVSFQTRANYQPTKTNKVCKSVLQPFVLAVLNQRFHPQCAGWEPTRGWSSWENLSPHFIVDTNSAQGTLVICIQCIWNTYMIWLAWRQFFYSLYPKAKPLLPQALISQSHKGRGLHMLGDCAAQLLWRSLDISTSWKPFLVESSLY